MNRNMKTFGEILRNPDNLTEEEKKEILDMAEVLKDLPKRVEAYKDLKLHDNNTEEVLSERFYQENFIMYAILETFLFKDKVSFGDINQSIILYAPKDFTWDISVARINMIIAKMIRLGFIEKIESENEYNPNFIITEEGIKIHQNQTLQTLASSAFYSYHTYELNKKANRLSKTMLVVTIISIIVAILSLLVTIYGFMH